jgi:hypothetical protein
MCPASRPFDAKEALARMRKRTDQAREHEAERLFAPENVDAVLSAAAARGQSAAIFSPSIGMDLSRTAAAVVIVDNLKASGFTVEWKSVRAKPDSEPETILRVSWGRDAGG